MENKIILIEDDEEIREMINDYLSGEFEVTSFNDGMTDNQKIPACRIVKNQDLLEELTKAKSEEEYSCQKNTQKEKMVLNL